MRAETAKLTLRLNALRHAFEGSSRYGAAMSLTREEVQKIARLARLHLTEEEIALYQKRLGRILEYVHELNSLETPKDAFVEHVPKDALLVRADSVQKFPDHDALMKNSPATEGNLFLLPTVVDHE